MHNYPQHQKKLLLAAMSARCVSAHAIYMALDIQYKTALRASSMGVVGWRVGAG